jgi:hypothetical protein
VYTKIKNIAKEIIVFIRERIAELTCLNFKKAMFAVA